MKVTETKNIDSFLIVESCQSLELSLTQWCDSNTLDFVSGSRGKQTFTRFTGGHESKLAKQFFKKFT